MQKSAIILLFIAILLGGVILLTVLIDILFDKSKPSSEPTFKLTEDEEPELTPKQQLEKKIKEVATIIKQRHETKALMLSIQEEGF